MRDIAVEWKRLDLPPEFLRHFVESLGVLPDGVAVSVWVKLDKGRWKKLTGTLKRERNDKDGVREIGKGQ